MDNNVEKQDRKSLPFPEELAKHTLGRDLLLRAIVKIIVVHTGQSPEQQGRQVSDLGEQGRDYACTKSLAAIRFSQT